MARVVLPRSLTSLTGGPTELELDAPDVRALMRLLAERFPAAAEQLEGMAVAIDGEIHSDPLLEPIESGSEVHFLPRIQGG